jgi:hypothetical protein
MDEDTTANAGVDHRATGTPEGAEWFRAMLEEIGETQASMARLMKRKGDDRNPETIARHMRRMANGEARVSGEMRVILMMMRRAKNRAEKRIAAAREVADHDVA